MSLENVKPALDRIEEHLGEIQDAREFLLKNSREIISLCSKAIISVHKGDIKNGSRFNTYIIRSSRERLNN